MGGRIVDVAVVESRPATMYVATASGGLWKTLNNGTTWKPVFDQEETVSLGAVAVARSNPDIVWVGTGEANPRNSVSWGNGVYRSDNGGKTWLHVGLADSAHIGRIVIHPQDPNIVYVAVLGRLWGPNPERGLYQTTDGGHSWRQIKFIDDATGFIDLVMDPQNPAILYAAAYQVRRDAFAGGNPAVQTGPGSGLYRSLNAGLTWERLSKGLPARPLGRCGLAVSPKNPRLVYAVIQTDRTTSTTAGQLARTSNEIDSGGVFRSDDRGETWIKLNDLCPRPFYYGQIRIDPGDDKRIYVLGISLHVSTDGGKTFPDQGARGVHPDHHALWIDPRDSDHLVLGNDGGLYFSYDRGATWEHVNNLPIGQFYGVGVDQRRPYRVYGGLQDNGSWSGPSGTRRAEGITPADWVRLLGADGFYCQVDPQDNVTVYCEGQYGRLHRVNRATGANAEIRPRPPKGIPPYRFNWSAPILISPHDSQTVYYGGNYLFRSRNRGDSWEIISPDLTRGRPGASANTGHTLTTIAESPLKPGLLYAGSDDGQLHVRENAGTWNDVSGRIPNLPADRWISRVECSHFAEGTAYVAIDRHRNDDRGPYLYKTTDYGVSWQPLAGDLPREGSVHVICEDPRNPDLLFVGTEFGLFVSLDAGRHWHRLRSGLPTVAVHDLVIHPRDRELVIATHGRSLYVLDVAPLEELTPRVLTAEAHLFDVKPAELFRHRGGHGQTGSKAFVAPNPPFGTTITYYVRSVPSTTPRIIIADASGRVVTEWKGAREPGLHRQQWDLRRSDTSVSPGDYSVQLRIGDRIWAKTVRVEAEE
jgi:photosystem II stability/assembly factor-like uncharacterized protein